MPYSNAIAKVKCATYVAYSVERFRHNTKTDKKLEKVAIALHCNLRPPIILRFSALITRSTMHQRITFQYNRAMRIYHNSPESDISAIDDHQRWWPNCTAHVQKLLFPRFWKKFWRRGKYCKKRCTSMDHWSGRTETATENWVGQAGSRRRCGSHSSVAPSIGPAQWCLFCTSSLAVFPTYCNQINSNLVNLEATAKVG